MVTKDTAEVPALPPRKRGRPRKDRSAPPAPAAPALPAAPEPDLFEGYVSDVQLARQRGLSIHTLRNERASGMGPPFTRDGRRILYSVEGFKAWLKAREVAPG